jgi:acylphosphatase
VLTSCISAAIVEKYLHRSEIDYDERPAGEASEREAIAKSNVIAKKCLVGGRVQGVFYRATAAQRARELGLTGHAINLPDGRVEVLACGEGEAVNRFIEWLWIGSSASKVTSVEVSELPGDHSHPASFRTA